MDTEKTPSNGKEVTAEIEDIDPIELVLFQVSECYVYIVNTLSFFTFRY